MTNPAQPGRGTCHPRHPFVALEPLSHRFRYFAVRGAAIGLLFAAVYGGTNALAQQTGPHQRLNFAWEHQIPFIEAWVYVYLTLFLMPLAPLFLINLAGLRRVAHSVALAILIAGAFFLLFPVEPAYQRPGNAADLIPAFRFLYTIDKPYNLFPSLHIALSTVYAAAVVDFNRRVGERAWISFFMILWLAFISASTLLIRQHNVIDIPSGFLLGVVCYFYTNSRLSRRNA